MKNLFAIIVIILICLGQNSVAQNSAANLDSIRQMIIQGKTTETNAILTKLMQSEPNNKTVVQFWLMANMKRSPTGELEAVNQLDSLAKIYPENTGIIFFKNFIYAEYGKNEEALAGFNKLIQLQPDTSLNYIGKGQVLGAMKRYEEASVAFERAIALDPSRPDVWEMHASSLAYLGKFDEALEAINKGIELNSGFPSSIYNRACIYCLKGDKVNALADLRSAFEKMPRLKQHARSDEDLKSLWEDEEFKKIIE